MLKFDVEEMTYWSVEIQSDTFEIQMLCDIAEIKWLKHLILYIIIRYIECLL